MKLINENTLELLILGLVGAKSQPSKLLTFHQELRLVINKGSQKFLASQGIIETDILQGWQANKKSTVITPHI